MTRKGLEAGLRRALKRNELSLHYQAKLSLADDSLVGVAALPRWRHPELGLLQPDQFLAVAEESGLIVAVGKWVLATACAQTMTWQAQGLHPVRIAVKVSPRQFADPNLAQVVGDVLEQSGMAPELLELEIAESMMMDDPVRALDRLVALKASGVRVA